MSVRRASPSEYGDRRWVIGVRSGFGAKKKGSGVASFTLRHPVALRKNRGLRGHDITKARKIMEANRDYMRGEWNAFFAG